MQKNSAQLLKNEEQVMIYIARLLFTLFFFLRKERITTHCAMSPEYYSETIELVEELFTGEAKEVWLNRIDTNMQQYWSKP